MLPKLIYFDKNIYNAVKKSLFIGSREYELIKNSIKSGIITIPGSITVLEEAMPIYRSKSKIMFMLERQVLSELVNWNLFIKYHADLLLEEIEAYLNDRKPNPFANYTMTPDILFSSDPKHITEWKTVDAETEKNKRQFLDGVKIDRQKYLDIPKEQRSVFPFSLLWEKEAVKVVGRYAEAYGLLEQCKKKGIDELLNFRAVRLAAGYELAYLYAKLVLEGKMLLSDSRDHHHVALTSATDIFVTNDDRLAKLLALIPMEKYTVWSYRQFIGWLALIAEGCLVPHSYYKMPWKKLLK
jgi:hypothetical protein